MTDFVLPFTVVVLGLTATMVGLGWLAARSRARSRGVGAAMISAIDEIFHPAAYDSYVEVQVQDERTAPRYAPDI